MGRNSGGIRNTTIHRTLSETTDYSEIQEFADLVIADGFSRGRKLSVGTISDSIVSDLKNKGITLQSQDVIITDSVIIKYNKHVKAKKGATIDSDKYRLVEKTVKKPSHIYEDTAQKYLVYVNTRLYSKGRLLKVVIHPNYSSKGEVINLIKSIGVVDKDKMKSPQYTKIK